MGTNPPFMSFSSRILKPGCAFTKVACSAQSIMKSPRILIITDELESKANQRSHEGRLAFELRKVGLDCTTLHITPEAVGWPEAGIVDEGAHLAQRMGAGAVIGMGSGKAMDATKIIAAGGIARPFSQRLPTICIPKTCGMGPATSSEAWVLNSEKDSLVPYEKQNDHSPQIILADPNLLQSLPAESLIPMALTALGGCIDGLIYWGLTEQNGNKKIYELGLIGIKLIAEGLKRIESHPDDVTARKNLLEASLAAGEVTSLCPAPTFKTLCLAWAPCFSPPLRFSVLGALLMPRVFSTVLAGLEERASGGDSAALCTLKTLDLAAKEISGQEGARAESLQRLSLNSLQLASIGDVSDLQRAVNISNFKKQFELIQELSWRDTVGVTFDSNDICTILKDFVGGEEQI
eukprot:CAMPEP_0117752158 /NCGR_PEP_ID=MMETSP0947-20121206/11439_1 /TAXON_ID=44440 /ORGANISM="Chattonella subsalsa, Strain CCMP2191" /LENGTH=405 /DNA_ID=CAMNT_0005570747 /DNA_START=399 /DNA_END=1616 /DNA_ORIENTATION=+